MRGFSTPSDWWREGYLHPEVTKAVCRPFRHRDPRPVITPHGGTRREWLKCNWWARRGERSADVRACRREVGWIPTPAEHHLICKRPGFLYVHSAGLRVIPIPVTPPPRFAAWSPLPQWSLTRRLYSRPLSHTVSHTFTVYQSFGRSHTSFWSLRPGLTLYRRSRLYFLFIKYQLLNISKEKHDINQQDFKIINLLLVAKS